ncbi:MAG: glycosyltransferase family 4 protein [Bacteroidota bacterium]|nr:glycosyltransferase family 4 protein [Bacteroidota bacterium]
MKKLLCLLPWTEFCDVHLVKDVGLFPEYFEKEYKIPVDFVFLDNRKTGTKLSEWHGMNLIKLPSAENYIQAPSVKKNPIKFFKFIKIFTNFLRKTKDFYSHIMMFHVSSTTLYLVRFIRKLDKNIKIYVKADASKFSKRQWFYLKQILKKTDVLSVENEYLLRDINKKLPEYSEKVEYIPNGFDNIHFSVELLSVPKENLIIQTARFGTAPKNTQLLLKILSNVDLKDWNVILAGTIEKDFYSFIESFFREYPELKDKIHFIGNISDQNELYRLYARAKVFILTSRFESFAISLIEAAYFGDYIVSTDVGIASTIKNNFWGFVANGNPMEQKNDGQIITQMSNVVQKLIDNPEYCIVDKTEKDKIRRDFSMSNIVKNEIFKGFFE